MVGGQLHDEGGGLSGEGFELFQNHAGNHHRPNADEEGRHRHQRGIAEHRPGKQTNDGHFRAAGDEARGHNGDLPVIFLLDGAGSQNSRHAVATSIGMMDLPDRPNFRRSRSIMKATRDI